MAINVNFKDDPDRFVSSHWVHTKTGDNKELVTLTGIVVVDLLVALQDWHRDTLKFGLRFPGDIVPPIRPGGGNSKILAWKFQVEHWAPFVTINAIAAGASADYSGWAVDAFRGPGNVELYGDGMVNLEADLAVRGIGGGVVIRVGYSLTLSGMLVEYETGV